MSNRILKRTGRVGAALAVGCAFAAPGAHAAAINLASGSPFVVLGGAGATNTGPSVLNGALGDSPTALSGFNTAVLNGPVHDNDAVAAQAQLDVGTAYDVAAAEPTSMDLTGTNLGNRTLHGRHLQLQQLRSAHRRRWSSTPRATRTRASCSTSARR